MRKIHNVHDFYGRHLFSRVLELTKYCLESGLPPSLLKLIDWSTLTEATQTLIDLGIKTEFIPDLVYSVELAFDDGTRTTIYLVIELKSVSDKKASVQVVGYTVRISEKSMLPTYSMILYTGQKNWQIPTYWQVIAGDYAKLIEPAVNHQIGSMHVWGISDSQLLSYKDYGVILLLLKHVNNLHNEKMLRTILNGFHKLIAIGKDLEVIWSIEYALAVDGNGVTSRRLQEIEETYFSDLPKENRVMPKFAISTDVAEQRGIKQGLEQGLEQGREQGLELGREQGLELGREQGREQEREQVVLAMLRSKMPEQDICKIVGLSVDELARIRKKL